MRSLNMKGITLQREVSNEGVGIFIHYSCYVNGTLLKKRHGPPLCHFITIQQQVLYNMQKSICVGLGTN